MRKGRKCAWNEKSVPYISFLIENRVLHLKFNFKTTMKNDFLFSLHGL